MNHKNARAARTARAAHASALTLALAMGCVMSGTAQTTGNDAPSTGRQSTTVAPGNPNAMGTATDRSGITPGTLSTDTSNTTYRNGDRNWDWLGLLGLVRLAGLRGKSDERDADCDTNRTTPTTR